MSTTTQQAKPRRKKLTEDELFIKDLVYDWNYGKSYAEYGEELMEKAYDLARTELRLRKFEVELASQAKLNDSLAEQTKVLAVEQAKLSITTMFQKTGWSAEKIADITGFPLDLVQKTVAGLNA